MLTHEDIDAVGLDLGFTGKQLDTRLRIMQACYPCCDIDFLHRLQKAPDAKACFAQHWDALEEATAWYDIYTNILTPREKEARAERYESYMRAVQKHGIYQHGLERVYHEIVDLVLSALEEEKC